MVFWPNPWNTRNPGFLWAPVWIDGPPCLDCGPLGPRPEARGASRPFFFNNSPCRGVLNWSWRSEFVSAFWIRLSVLNLSWQSTGGCATGSPHHRSWNPEFLDSWNPGFQDSWIPWILDSWTPGFLDSWISGFLESWKSWTPGILESWTSWKFRNPGNPGPVFNRKQYSIGNSTQ